MKSSCCELKDVRETTLRIIDQHSGGVGATLNTLNDIQEKYKYIPLEALETLSENMGIPYSRLYCMCTLFDRLSLIPTGRYILEICDGTACHTLGSEKLITIAEEILGISVGETTSDGLITLRRVNCVGACSQAPIMIADGQFLGRFRLQNVREVTERLQEQRDA